MAQTNEELEQGFNEEELADIMTEIESLESDSVPTKSSQSKLKVVEKSDGESSDEEHEDSDLDEDSPRFQSDDLTEETIKGPSKSSAPTSVPENKLQQVIDQEIQQVKGNSVKQAASPSAQTKPESQKQTAHESSMALKVSGKLKLQLQFEVSGNSVALIVNEDEGLSVELPGGAIFKLPFAA